MTDIVERLRERREVFWTASSRGRGAELRYGDAGDRLCREAADEIERLRGELAQRVETVGLDAIRQCIEERDEMERKYHYLAQEMVYEGNSVAWWRSKAMAYRDAIGAVWDALRAAGIASDGQKTSADGVRELAAKSPQRKPLSDEQQAALSLMLDHFGNDKRVQCLRPLVKSAHGIGD